MPRYEYVPAHRGSPLFLLPWYCLPCVHVGHGVACICPPWYNRGRKDVCELTNNQYRIFKAVRKYRTLPKILSATGISDYLTLQEDAGIGMLDFSDCEMDENTIVTLTNPAAEALESRRRANWDFFLTHIVAVYAAIMATIAIIVEIVLHFL
nr:MAG TPA: hypothetical protein [Caudoviricetes sp.]